MVLLISDGYLEIGANVCSNLGYSICLRHLFRSTIVTIVSLAYACIVYNYYTINDNQFEIIGKVINDTKREYESLCFLGIQVNLNFKISFSHIKIALGFFPITESLRKFDHDF